MKTLQDLKRIIDYQQTDDIFLDFLSILAERGLIDISEDDITKEGEISCRLFDVVVGLYGVTKEESLIQV
ncbi:hypothetical protein AHYW_002605 [Providencia manganoxydans]|uniref:hypothetical protein n=1 Tax=Providencia manganoxydans TaxID=2923283 RepID=UPI003DA02363